MQVGVRQVPDRRQMIGPRFRVFRGPIPHELGLSALGPDHFSQFHATCWSALMQPLSTKRSDSAHRTAGTRCRWLL